MKMLSQEEICFDASSYVDPSGRVFFWNDRIFRGVTPAMAPHMERILECGSVSRLCGEGKIIESARADICVDPFAFVLEHRRVSYPSYCVEWPPRMLKDAALLTLEIALEVSADDVTLQDAYPWNVFFEGTKPVFIDIGSLVPARDDVLWAPYDQFCNFFLFPLYMYSAGRYECARRFLFDYFGGLPARQFFLIAPFLLKARHPLRYTKLSVNHYTANIIQRMHAEEKIRAFVDRSYKTFDVSRGRKRFIASLIKEVESINVSAARSRWRSYYEDKENMCSYKEEDFARKENIVRDVVCTYRPSSVLDMGCNTGVYSLIATESGATKVIAMDIDEPSVSQLYDDAKNKKADILPLVMDALNPTPSFGWSARQFPSAIERFKADMVFAFALIHHLAITRLQGFDRALDMLDAFTNKYVFLEFVDKNDPKVIQLMAHSQHTYPWYSFDEFKRVLAKRYTTVVYYEPHTPTRSFVMYAK